MTRLWALNGAQYPIRPGLSNWIVSTITNPLLILALAVYGVATLLWIFSLRNVPLSLAYPFVALAFVFVPVMAHFALSEPLKAKTFYGFILILAGVTISVIEF